VDQDELRIWQAVGWVQNLAVTDTAYCVVCAGLEFTAFGLNPLTGHNTALQASSTYISNREAMQLKNLKPVSENSHDSQVAPPRLGSVKGLW
jgi:hypothetical protein